MAETAPTPSQTQEFSVLQKFGLRYAVLGAWHEELRGRGIPFGPELPRQLEATRVKISSGCFSTCQVGCDLGDVERALMSAASSAPDTDVESWMELLGWSMGEPKEISKLLKLARISVQYNNCGFGPCGCGT
ncbi:MAG: hypothetical protein V1495_05735 [Pseudomonadota bacterium]